MDESKFWSHALGAWIKDCVSGPSAIVPERSWRAVDCIPLKYSELCDGFCLNLLFYFIHPTAIDKTVLNRQNLATQGLDSRSRLKLLHHLIRNLHLFYKNKLNRVITMDASPDLLSLVKYPVPEVSAHELNKILLLLIGCAVQSDQKEHFISKIQCMRTDLQESIVHEIQKVTNNQSLDVQALEFSPEDHRFLTVLDYLERVMKERDDYANGILEMTTHSRSDLDEIEYGSTGATTSSSSCNGDVRIYKEIQYEMRSPSPGSMERHTVVELAGLNAEIRRLKNELESKDEILMDMEEQAKEHDLKMEKMKQERLQLIKDARASQDYKDDLDCLQGQMQNYRRYEAENVLLRKKIEELSFYRNCSDDLQKTVDNLHESINILESECDQYKRRLENMNDVEQKLLESQLQVKHVNQEHDLERTRVEELIIENGKLERDIRQWTSKYADLEKQIEAMDEFNFNDSTNNSLFSEIEMSNRSQIVELQLENRKLKSQLDNSVVSEPGETFDLKERLSAAERQAEDKLAEVKRMFVELESVKEAKEAAECKLESLKAEHEKMSHSVNETKRQLATAQSELHSHKTDDSMARRVAELEDVLNHKEQALIAIQSEKTRLDGQIEKMRTQQKESRNEIDNLKDEVANFENLLVTAERAKKILENERNGLKTKADSLEDKYDELNGRLINYETMERRLANSEAQLVEKTNTIADLEADNRTARQQMELESKKTRRLREDLVCEKSRIGDLLARLRSVCNAIRSHGGKLNAKEEAIEDDSQLIDVIDDVIMQALNAARREADALRLQQQLQIAELDDLKKDIEALRRAESELNGSDDRFKELVLENQNVKEQVSLLQERLRKLQVDDSTKTAELQAARREMEELQNKNLIQSRQAGELAKLQVQLRNAQMQEDLMREDNGELQKQIELTIKSKADFERKLQSIEATQTALIADYDRLQNLHQLLGADYDRAKFELQQLKQRLKGERMASEGAVRSEFAREKMHLEQQLRCERDESMHDLQEAQADIARLHKELDEYKREHSTMLRNTDERSDELRRLRVAECSQKTTISSLNGTIQQLNHVLSGKDMELSTLRRQVDMLRQYNGDESHSLIKQIELLLVKNQELHERSLNDKDSFHACQRDLHEQLVTLRRNKEKLEEKIMDQYKSMDSRKIKEKDTFVKRAAKALMPKNSSRKALRALPAPACNGSTTEDSSVEENANGFTSPTPNGNQNGYNQPTTSCSSDMGSGPSSSPDYEIFPLAKSETVGCDSFALNNRIRARNGLVGGSMRLPNHARPQFLTPGLRSSIRTRPIIRPVEEDAFSLYGSERGIDVPTPLPTIIRHTRSVSNAVSPLSSMHKPPPYLVPQKAPSKASNSALSSTSTATPTATGTSASSKPPPPYPCRIQTPLSPIEFCPKDTSTPTPKDPLQRKTSSFYENVDLPVALSSSGHSETPSVSHSRAGSAVWFEYGCV